jgi:uncharacterized membrane protein
MNGEAVQAPLKGSQRRLVVFDALRGFFMLLMAAGHLLRNLRSDQLAHPALQFLHAALIGTVGFMTVSGMLAGYLLERSPAKAARTVLRYRRQAIKLILIAHPLLLLALYAWKRAGGVPPDLIGRTWFITDTLAIVFLAVVPFIARVPPRVRLALGVTCLFVGRLLYVLRPAQSGFGLLIVDALAGADTHARHILYEDYPLLSVTGIFLIGSWIGRQFLDAERAADLRSFADRFRRTFPLLLLITTGCLVVWAILRHGPQTPLRAFFYPDLYFTTYPAYLATVLGLACLILYRGRAGSLESFIAVFGRNSLFIYVVQYYVMQTIPLFLGWRHRMSPSVMVLYYAGAIVFLNLVARGFERLQSGRSVPTLSEVSPGPGLPP